MSEAVREEPPATPPAKATNTQIARVAHSSSTKRVHFSPRNEEIYTDTSPQSSPTRARARAFSHGILKRCTDDQHNEDTNDRSSPIPELFDSAFVGLVEQIEGGAEGRARLYNSIAGKIARNTARLPTHTQELHTLIASMRRDISDTSADGALVLAVIKTAGCVFHCSACDLGEVSETLEEICTRVMSGFSRHKAMCQALAWCTGMLRMVISQRALEQLVRFAATTMIAFAEPPVQFECLTALSTLVRRQPVYTRRIAHVWCVPVIEMLASSAAGIRALADSILRPNIPWVSACCVQLDSQASAFVKSRIGYMMRTLAKLANAGHGVYAARAWGMIVVVGARHVKVGAVLQAIEVCVNARDSRVVVAALTQWRCLVFALVVNGRARSSSAVDLILAPILVTLGSRDQDVCIASIRTWATLVYGLGDGISTQLSVVERVAEQASGMVSEVVARVLAALFNQYVLPVECKPKFVVPQMVVGITTLAARDGKSLADTNGPFSSEAECTGDHTQVLCRYVVGVCDDDSARSLLHITAKFLGRYCTQLCTGRNAECSLESFTQLCRVFSKVISQFIESKGELGAEYAALALEPLVNFLPQRCTCQPTSNGNTPHAILYDALHACLKHDFSRCIGVSLQSQDPVSALIALPGLGQLDAKYAVLLASNSAADHNGAPFASRHWPCLSSIPSAPMLQMMRAACITTAVSAHEPSNTFALLEPIASYTVTSAEYTLFESCVCAVVRALQHIADESPDGLAQSLVARLLPACDERELVENLWVRMLALVQRSEVRYFDTLCVLCTLYVPSVSLVALRAFVQCGLALIAVHFHIEDVKFDAQVEDPDRLYERALPVISAIKSSVTSSESRQVVAELARLTISQVKVPESEDSPDRMAFADAVGRIWAAASVALEPPVVTEPEAGDSILLPEDGTGVSAIPVIPDSVAVLGSAAEDTLGSVIPDVLKRQLESSVNSSDVSRSSSPQSKRKRRRRSKRKRSVCSIDNGTDSEVDVDGAFAVIESSIADPSMSSAQLVSVQKRLLDLEMAVVAALEKSLK